MRSKRQIKSKGTAVCYGCGDELMAPADGKPYWCIECSQKRITTKERCKRHVWWHRVTTEDYVCANCGKVVKYQPADLTFEDCKKCDKYPCKLGCSIVGDYNKEYLKRHHLNDSFVHLIDCPDKRKARKNMGGFIDSDGRHYAYAPNQQPSVDNVPYNVKGSGGIVGFTVKCKCCEHTTGKRMWEPQYEEFKRTHKDFTTKVAWYK